MEKPAMVLPQNQVHHFHHHPKMMIMNHIQKNNQASALVF
jgi:hypothetical protein